MKPLYLATSLSELDEQTQFPLGSHRSRTLVSFLPKLYDGAEAKRNAGDEEAAYILYRKFVLVAQAVMLRSGDKNYFAMIDGSKLKRAKETSAALELILSERYEDKKEEDRRLRETMEMAEAEEDIMMTPRPAAINATSSRSKSKKWSQGRQIHPSQQLQEALDIKEMIRAKSEQIALLDKQLFKLSEEKVAKAEEVAALKELPGYLDEDEIAVLMTKASVEPASEVKDSVKDCPVCFQESPSVIFCCVQCDNWICGDCRTRLVLCPSCRDDFLARPPKRNRAIERLFAAL